MINSADTLPASSLANSDNATRCPPEAVVTTNISQPSSVAGSTNASPHLIPTLINEGNIIQHQPPSILQQININSQATLPSHPTPSLSSQPQLQQQRPGLGLHHSQSMPDTLSLPSQRHHQSNDYSSHIPRRNMAQPSSASSSRQPAGWVDMYDQKSDHESGVSSEGEPAASFLPPSDARSPKSSKSHHAASNKSKHHNDSTDDSENESPRHHHAPSMSASSSSSSLRSMTSTKKADSTLRKGISSSMKGLSASSLKEIEAYVRRLAIKESKRNKRMSGPSASMQIEGKMMSWQDEEDGINHLSQSQQSNASHFNQHSSDEDDLERLSASRSSSHDHPQSVFSQAAPNSLGNSGIIASPGMGLPSLGMQRNWNAEFQSCFTAICNDATILDNVAGYSALSSLAHDFLWTASTLGRIIISEKQLPEHQKTIPSINVGGYAGGLKYIAHNILFKFAVDNQDSLYGGDQYAAKAAGHELLGLSHYYRTIASSEGRLGLHVPLAALIDFRGYRLYAICKLPIDGTKTLVLGSMNGGNTIINSNDEMNAKMCQVAEVLNLKVHPVTDGAGTKTLLPSCFDIEGHLGRDGKFYLVDFHRTFPPEPPAVILAQHLAQEREREQREGVTRALSINVAAPGEASSPVSAAPSANTSPSRDVAASHSTSPTSPPPTNLATLHQHQSTTQLKNTYLYRLLRPELVRSYTPSPLSSNVYSVFDRDPENYQHVMSCYRLLIEKIIPNFARELEKNPPPTRFVDSGIQMQQQTANMIRTSSGGNSNTGPASNASLQTPHLSRSPSISSMVSPYTDLSSSSNNTAGGGVSSSIPQSTPVQHLPPPTLSLDVLSSVLHQSGINVRYLGLVRSQMRCESWRMVFLVEILARLLKNELRARWRSIKIKSMSDGPFRSCAVSFINLIFFPSLASNTYWAEFIHKQINLSFPGTLIGDEIDPKIFNLKSRLSNTSTSSMPPPGPFSKRHHKSASQSSSMNFSPMHQHRDYHPTCPIHHATHTHVGVDPADPLSFLPPLNAHTTSSSATTEKSTGTLDTNTTATNSSSTSQPSQPSGLPQMLRSPSLPGMVVPPPVLFGRSVSTSVGYVKQQSHLPTPTAGSTAQPDAPVTPQKRTMPPSGHTHSASTPAASTGPSNPNAKKPRPPNILDAAPDIPCPGAATGTCCSSGRKVDYLLLLFMRFIQLSGIVLEEGIMEAIQDAADKQQASEQLDSPEPLQRQTSTAVYDHHDPDHTTIVVGEGALQLDRYAMLQRDRQTSLTSSSNTIAVPHPYLRSITEPKASPFTPTSPPSLQHTHSTRDASAYPPLPGRHANSPATSNTANGPTLSRNVSVSNLATNLSIVSPINWRPSSLISSIPSTPIPSTPPSASGRSTPHGHDPHEGFTRSRSGSFVMPMLSPSGSGDSLLKVTSPGEIWNLWSWPFVAPLEEMHIRGLVEKVKQVNLLWYAEGTSLLIKSWEKLQQHNRWVADQHSNASGNTMPRDSPAGLAHTFNQKRFFLPGHLQSDEVFRDGPTPFLKMAFHLAGLAANKYQQALKYCLDDNLTLCNLSFLMSAVYNKYASAMSYLKRAVQANPMHVRSWYYLGQLYHYHLHDHQQAKACYEKALSLAPNQSHANTLKDYGNLMQYAFNNPVEAAAKYRRALEVEPRHIKSLQLLAQLETRTCDSLKDYDAVKKLLYDAARSPMGVIETRINAQEKYLNFVICQAELYADEHAHQHTQAAQQGGSGSNTPPTTGVPPVNNLVEASKRWREAIDFLQCPHIHIGSSRDTGAGDDASSTVANQAALRVALPAGLTNMSNLSLTSTQSQQSVQPTAIQFMVSSSVVKPSSITPTVTRPPSRPTSASGERPLGDFSKRATSDAPLPPVSESSSVITETSTPAAGFSWCVCPDCCAVNFDSLPLADTLLSYAQFIHQYEAVPPAGLINPAAQAYTNAKTIEAEKYFQWSILVHHTLVTSRKKHKQVQMKYEMNPEHLQSSETNTTTSLYRPNMLSKSGAIPSLHTSNVHEVLATAGPLNQTAYPFVPPAVKTAYLMTAPTFNNISSALPSPSVASAANASVLLEVAAPFLTPGWLTSLGVVASFNVIVGKPHPVQPLPPPNANAFMGEAERRLEHMTSIMENKAVSGLSILSSISSPSSAASSTAPTPTAASSSSTMGSGAGSDKPTLTRPASSWDASNPKKWTNMPPVIPSTPVASAAATTTTKESATTGTTNPTKYLQRAHSNTTREQMERELIGSELALEIDLEFDGSIERRCECAVDHSFGESATSCSCSFPSPRYLVCYALFLMRIGRPSQAAYAFQSALVLHPFGRTGSSCLARMVDCAIRSGILAPGPHYGANVVTVYSLFRKAVGLDVWEGASNASDNNDSIANKHTFIASITAAKLFQSFLKDHANAVGPIVSAPSTPTSTTSSSSHTSTGPQIGPLLKGADVTLTTVSKMIEQINADMTSSIVAYKASSASRDKTAPTFALARANTNCKCLRPLRGKQCLCQNQLLKGMITKAHQMRSRVENKRKAQLGLLRHNDAATMQQQQGGRGRGGERGNIRGGRGGGRGGGNNTMPAPDRQQKVLQPSAREEEKTTETGEDGQTPAPILREGSGKWAQMVVKSESVASNLPKRTGSSTNTLLVKESSKESTGSRDGITSSGKHPNVHVTTNSGASTPSIATPITASPAIGPMAASTSNLIGLASLAPLAPTTTSPQSASSATSSTTTATSVAPVATVPLLPTSSQWLKAPPSLVIGVSPSSTPAPITPAAAAVSSTFASGLVPNASPINSSPGTSTPATSLNTFLGPFPSPLTTTTPNATSSTLSTTTAPTPAPSASPFAFFSPPPGSASTNIGAVSPNTGLPPMPPNTSGRPTTAQTGGSFAFKQSTLGKKR